MFNVYNVTYSSRFNECLENVVKDTTNLAKGKGGKQVKSDIGNE